MSKLRDFEEHITIPVPGTSIELSAIIAQPKGVLTDHYVNNFSPPTHRIAIILHGQGGHKSYIYLSKLAEDLSEKLGMYSIRFDFRNCGDSSLTSDEDGRTLQTDLDDLSAIYQYLTTRQYNGKYVFVDSIIGHSRGALCMFNWCLENPNVYVPNLINCGGRFDGAGLDARTTKNFPDWKEKGGLRRTSHRSGAYKQVWIPAIETESLIEQELSKIHNLGLYINVLSVYGLKDTVVPLQDAAKFSNALGGRHTLEFISDADHNYHGVESVEHESEADLLHPVHRKKKVYDFNYIVVDKIINYLTSENALIRFYDRSLKIETNLPRWKDVEGISNFRDIGGWLTEDRKHYFKSGIAFRCANPYKVTDKGIKEIQRLNIKAIFDLRSLGERQEHPFPPIAGIENIHVPLFGSQSLAPADALLMYSKLFTSWSTYVSVYEDILDQGTKGLRRIFEFIRDHPGQGFIFHCTAGKDRTGVLAMLILLIAGVSPQVICREYELTAIGLKPDHEDIRDKFMGSLGKLEHTTNGQQFLQMVTKNRKNWTIYKDGFENLISSKYEAMLETIELIETKYGGVQNLFVDKIGLSLEDMVKIRSNLLE